MALVLTIGGNDHTSELVHESLVVSQTSDGFNSTCTFDLIDTGVLREDAWTVEHTRVEDGDVITGHVAFSEPKVEVSIVDGATVYFAGILSRITVVPMGVVELRGVLAAETQILKCSCHDFNAILEESIVTGLAEYTNKTDEFIIDDIFGLFVAGIDFATHVDGDVFTFDYIGFERMTVRQVMDLIVAQTGYIWYIDYSKKLHYSVLEANTPAWHLSDAPDGANSFSYLDPILKEEDATNLVNRVFVVAGTDFVWRIDQPSVDKYGLHQYIVRDDSLEGFSDQQAARGDAILDKFAEPIVTYKLKTYKDGLRAAVNVRVVCAYYDLDETLLINRLVIKFPVDGAPIYELTLGGLESSSGAAAQRLTLDYIYSGPPIPASQLPLASRGWGHDLICTATDHNPVAWEGPGAGNGTLTTASGQDFAIAPGNSDDPGAMTEKTIVYLDLVEDPTSPHDLQMTTSELAALGTHKVMVAVCWPGIAAAGAQPEVLAGFQVFGSTVEVATFLNATNIIANAITANEIYVSSLSAIVADMGLLIAGEIRMIGAAGSMTLDPTGIKLFDGINPAADNIVLHVKTADGTFNFASAVAGNPRIEITNTEVAGYDGADVLQFQLDAATGKALAGAGAVMLDEDGVTFGGADLAVNRLKWDTATPITRMLFAGIVADAGAPTGVWEVGPPNAIADPSRIYITTEPQAGNATYIFVESLSTGNTGRIEFYIDEVGKLQVYGTRVNIGTDTLFRVGTGVADPAADVEDGQLFYRTDTDKLRLRANGAWVNLN